MTGPLIFSSQDSQYLAKLIASGLNQWNTLDPLGYVNNSRKIERKDFGGVEKYLRLDLKDRAELLGQDVVYVSSTHTDDAFDELVRVGSALAGYGARRRIFVIPFFGYSTMERAVEPGEVVTAKVCCRTLSAIPNTVMGNTFLMLDLHVSGITHYFEGDCLRFELYSENSLIGAIKELGLPAGSFMFGSADLGRPKWVKTFARHFGTSMALIDKDRQREEVSVNAVVGDVRDKTVIIYDDMTRSANTIIQAAEAYLNAGATGIYVVLSHFALNDPGVLHKLVESPILKVITTNSHPMTQHQALSSLRERFKVIDISPLFVNAIKRITGEGEN